MEIQEFEKQIQKEIDSDLEVRINPNAPDMAGVYYQGVYLGVGLPANGIYEDHRPGYTNSMGYPHRNISKTLEHIEARLPTHKKMVQDDPDLFDPVKFKKYTD